MGVLALQGGFQAHARMLTGLGARVREVRVPGDLEGLQGLVIPGGESTTMTLGIAREGLAEPLRALARGEGTTGGAGREGAAGGAGREGAAGGSNAARAPRGVPILGSCAGLIMLDRAHLGLMDIRAARNAFGRQIRSFEADLDVRGLAGGPLRGVFIRAPWIAEHGPGVEILAELDGHPVAARQGDLIAVAFHAELTDDERIHRLLLDAIAQRHAAA